MPKAKKSARTVAAKFNGGKTLAIFLRFDGDRGREARAALERLAKHYELSMAEVARRLFLEADLRRQSRKGSSGLRTKEEKTEKAV